jgi:putative heme transporter
VPPVRLHPAAGHRPGDAGVDPAGPGRRGRRPGGDRRGRAGRAGPGRARPAQPRARGHLLALLLAGAAAAGLASPVLFTAAAVTLAAGSAGVIAATHRLRGVTGWLAARYPGTRAVRMLATAASLARLRAGYRRGTAVLLLAGMTWLAEAAVLAAAFELAGLPIPWHGLLLAYTASQLTGSLVPLPGGLGSVDGGLLGALTLTGTPLAAAAAAAVIYRVIGYWAAGAVATCAAAAMKRRHLTQTSRTRPGGKQPVVGPPARSHKPCEPGRYRPGPD